MNAWILSLMTLLVPVSRWQESFPSTAAAITEAATTWP